MHHEPWGREVQIPAAAAAAAAAAKSLTHFQSTKEREFPEYLP